MRKTLALVLLGTVSVAGALLLTVGLLRYDGPEGLARRVRVEIDARRPHPDFVPTPLAVVPRARTTDSARDETQPVVPAPTRCTSCSYWASRTC